MKVFPVLMSWSPGFSYLHIVQCLCPQLLFLICLLPHFLASTESFCFLTSLLCLFWIAMDLFDYCYSFSVSELSDFLLRNYSKSFSCYDTFHRPVWLSYSTFQTGPWYSIQTTFLNSIVITSELILYVSNSFEMLH